MPRAPSRAVDDFPIPVDAPLANFRLTDQYNSRLHDLGRPTAKINFLKKALTTLWAKTSDRSGQRKGDVSSVEFTTLDLLLRQHTSSNQVDSFISSLPRAAELKSRIAAGGVTLYEEARNAHKIRDILGCWLWEKFPCDKKPLSLTLLKGVAALLNQVDANQACRLLAAAVEERTGNRGRGTGKNRLHRSKGLTTADVNRARQGTLRVTSSDDSSPRSEHVEEEGTNEENESRRQDRGSDKDPLDAGESGFELERGCDQQTDQESDQESTSAGGQGSEQEFNSEGNRDSDFESNLSENYSDDKEGTSDLESGRTSELQGDNSNLSDHNSPSHRGQGTRSSWGSIEVARGEQPHNLTGENLRQSYLQTPEISEYESDLDDQIPLNNDDPTFFANHDDQALLGNNRHSPIDAAHEDQFSSFNSALHPLDGDIPISADQSSIVNYQFPLNGSALPLDSGRISLVDYQTPIFNDRLSVNNGKGIQQRSSLQGLPHYSETANFRTLHPVSPHTPHPRSPSLSLSQSHQVDPTTALNHLLVPPDQMLEPRNTQSLDRAIRRAEENLERARADMEKLRRLHQVQEWTLGACKERVERSESQVNSTETTLNEARSRYDRLVSEESSLQRYAAENTWLFDSSDPQHLPSKKSTLPPSSSRDEERAALAVALLHFTKTDLDDAKQRQESCRAAHESAKEQAKIDATNYALAREATKQYSKDRETILRDIEERERDLIGVKRLQREMQQHDIKDASRKRREEENTAHGCSS